jgi:Rod binding domain-containing protein
MISFKPDCVPPDQTESAIDPSRGTRGKTLEGEKARLRKVTNEFEAFFTHYLLKTMRETVPESPFSEEGLLSSGSGKEMFTDLFDMELARHVTSGNDRSIAALLYKSMEPLVVAEYEQAGDNGDVAPLTGRRPQAIPIESPRFHDIVPAQRSEPIPIRRESSRVIVPETDARKLDGPSSAKQREPLRHRGEPARNANEIVSRFGRHIRAAARDTGLDPALITAVIETESRGDSGAISAAGAKGLMQLADSTAGDYKVERVFDPEENIRAGSRYLRRLVDRFGDHRLALAAYNAGPENVKQYGGIPPFEETQAYVEKVITRAEAIRDTLGVNKAKGRQ